MMSCVRGNAYDLHPKTITTPSRTGHTIERVGSIGLIFAGDMKWAMPVIGKSTEIDAPEQAANGNEERRKGNRLPHGFKSHHNATTTLQKCPDFRFEFALNCVCTSTIRASPSIVAPDDTLT